MRRRCTILTDLDFAASWQPGTTFGAAETRLEVDFQGGILELLPNDALAQVTRTNLTKLNDLTYDADEKFARRIQERFEEKPAPENIKQVFNVSGVLGKGSTGVGDISWVVPTAGFTTACWVPAHRPRGGRRSPPAGR